MNNFGLREFAQGAKTTTVDAPHIDGNIDLHSSSFAKKTRTELKYLNVNNTAVPAVVATATLLTIGSSLSTQVETEDSKFDEEAEKIIEYHEKKDIGELTNTYNGDSAKMSMSDFDMLNGGFLIVHHYNMNSGWKFPYRYEIISVDRIDSSKNTYFYEKNLRTTNGMVFNRWNQIKALWLYTNDSKTSSVKVSMKNITYYSEVWISLGQRLAVSKIISMMPTLDRIEQYSKAELLGAIESAKAGGYLHTTAFEEIMTLVKEQIDTIQGKDSNETFKKRKDLYTEILRDLKNIGVTQNGLTPVPLNDTITPNNKDNSSIYDNMNENSERAMASSLGYSQIGMFKRLDKANYTSAKLALEFDAKMGETRFNKMKDVFIDINKRIITTAIQIGWLKKPKDFFKDIDRKLNFSFIRKTAINIEPSKTAAANEKNLKNKIDTRRRIIESTYGIKYETYLKNMKKDEDIEQEILGRPMMDDEVIKEVKLNDEVVK